MPEIITQKIKVKAIAHDTFRELMLWGDSAWWPSRCPMDIENLSGNHDVGARYRQSVKFLLGPEWVTVNKVIDKKNLYLRRDFFGKAFDGFEEYTIAIDDDGNSEITFTFAAELKGRLNKYLWKKFGRQMHIDSITMILKALKEYLEKKQ